MQTLEEVKADNNADIRQQVNKDSIDQFVVADRLDSVAQFASDIADLSAESAVLDASGGGVSIKMMTFCDSITNQGINNSGTTLRFSNQGWWVHTMALLRQPVVHVFNAAVSGYTVAQILADLPAQLETYKPDWLWGIPGQNNLGDADISGALATVTQILTLAKSAGAKVLIGTVTPRTSMSSLLIQNISALNAHYRKMEAQGLCYLFDSHAAIIDISSSTGASLAGVQYDNIHPNAYGALRIGYLAYLRLKNEFPVLSPDRGISNADNRTTNTKSNILSLNAKTIGTGGTFAAGGSGSGATSWLIGRSAGSVLTAVASKEVSTSIYKAEEWQRIDFSGTIAAQETIRFQQSIALSSLNPALATGDKIIGHCKLKMSGLSSNFYNVRLAVELLNATPAVTDSTIALADSASQMVAFHAEEVVLRTQALALTASTVNIRITIYTDFVAGAVAGSISITDAFMELVP